MSAPPVTDHLPIALRAYAEPLSKNSADAKRKPRRSKLGASSWTLLFDTETTTDASQALRFGTYQVRKAADLYEAGIFYDPEGITLEELVTLKTYASKHGLELLTRDQFADQVFYRYGYSFRGRIVGFNLPFDISRIAIRHGPARGRMRGGFSFKISDRKYFPRLQVRHHSSRAAFIQFAAVGQPDDRSARRRGRRAGVQRGHFLDVKTIAGALFARPFSLASLSAFLKVENPKLEFDEFDGPITEEMIRYAVGDVQATWECREELLKRFDILELGELQPERVFSEASIGKGYLRAMGVKAWRELQPDFPPQLLANIMGSYFGGRSEVRIRRDVRQVILCDFLSMYPTVCVLMGLWRFVIAQGKQWRDATMEARQLLESTAPAELQSQSFWQQLWMLVRVLPDADILPVRANYSDEAQSTIGTNYLTNDHPQWFTLADCIAAKLLTGKAPVVVEAIAFSPGPSQRDLKPINISGNADYRVDPAEDDFFRRVIELRQSIKDRRDSARGQDWDVLETEQFALKIAANATSYGMYAEVNVEEQGEPRPVTVYSSTRNPFSFSTGKAEQPGPFSDPLLATLITGAARLMLALAERMITDRQLEWCFCDTDSMAIAKPEQMSRDEFEREVGEIVNWFAPLNPYEFGRSILKVEPENYALAGPRGLEPLYCFAVSAKRYALFNLSAEGQPIMRKVSAHGLGHLRAPYEADDAPAHIPTPDQSVLREGTERWHCDLWWQIINAALSGHPDRVGLDYHSGLSGPAISRYGATTPKLLRWFKPLNAKRPYPDQVKPFGFLLALQAEQLIEEEIIASQPKGRRRRKLPIKPVAPFDKDYAKAVSRAFDRESGNAVPVDQLKSYAAALCDYQIHPESKFLNGDYLNRGCTTRRHIRVTAVEHIGKEANNWEEQAFLGFSEEALPTYGVGATDPAALSVELRPMIERLGIAPCARALGISAATLSKFIDHPGGVKEHSRQLIASRMDRAKRLFAMVQATQESERAELSAAIQRDGLRPTARRLGMDASNLRRWLRR
jgi:hypothetical protein